MDHGGRRCGPGIGQGPAGDGRLITPVARFAVRYAVPVLVGWALVVVAFGLIGRGVEEKVQPSLLFVPGTESDRWRDVRAGQLQRVADRPARRPRAARSTARARELAAALERRPRTRAISPWSGDAEQLEALRPEPAPGGDQRRPADPAGRRDINTVIGPLEEFVDEHVQARRSRAHLAGIPSLGSEVNEASIDALHKGELIAAPILILVLLLVFRSPVAGGDPARDRRRHGASPASA